MTLLDKLLQSFEQTLEKQERLEKENSQMKEELRILRERESHIKILTVRLERFLAN